ncbi:uncharacterized protein [Halyomorpha halys]|uniref:uncharacterized protein n=1 Tax=Halyomorpha halys TaxID=286706 RepID=UPI0006D50336|nr:uncharacterized protein LOC106679174 [Halyomorpha halys]
MAEIPLVLDTNMWADLRLILTRLQKKTGKSFEDLWKAFNDDFIKETLNPNEREAFRSVTNFMKRLLEMKNSSAKYVIYVPSFVYNEAGRSVSSKITSDAKGDELFLDIFNKVVKSIPIETKVDNVVLEEGIGYPKKSEIKTGNIIKTMMKDFLKNNKQATLIQLIDFLKNADEGRKQYITERTNWNKHFIADVLHKNQKWDQPMGEACKVLGLDYEPRTKALSSLYGSIHKYRDVDKIPFQPDPVEAIADRLTMADEEFDFFDLLIYLHAKENKAYIITRNTQAYQEINDPSFLGYFEDVKIMHPLINFDSLDDLKNSGELLKIIETSIKKDFNELDLPICRELDQQLSKPVFVEKGGELITKALSSYSSPFTQRLKIEMSLGIVLRVLRIENKQLKASREFFFEEYNTNKVSILRFIDENFFNNQLKSEDFVKDDVVIEKTRKQFLKSKLLSNYLKNNPLVEQQLKELQKNPGKYLDGFLTRYRTEDGPGVRNLFLALAITSHLSESEIDQGLHQTTSQEPISFKNCPPSGSAKKRQAPKCLLNWEQIEEFNEEKVENRDPLKVKINSEKFVDYIRTIRDPEERIQLIEFTDQVLNSVEDHTSKISGPKVTEVTHIINNHKVLKYFTKVHEISTAVNYGMFARSILADLLKGNFEGLAINVGFMAGNYALSRISAASLVKGVKYAEEGKVMLGASLKYASPFISRFLSPLVALDLYNQIKALKAGDSDAIVGIVGDSVLLIVDAVDIGISLLEIAGVIGEISAVTGPIGVAIGAVVMVGTEIYFAVSKVQKLNDIIHLTTGERWEIGAATFFTFGLAKFNVENLAKIKAANNQVAKQALEAIKNSPDIQRIVVPSVVSVGDKPQIAEHSRFRLYYGTLRWDRTRPDDPEGGKIFCAPEGDWETAPRNVISKCTNAIGVADLTPKKKDYTLFNLGEGGESVIGLRDSPNIFRVTKGKFEMSGGNKNDVFILEEGITFDNFPEGILDGSEGSNMLDFRAITTKDNEAVVIKFTESPIGNTTIYQATNLTTHEYRERNLHLFGIDSVIGRENQVDYIYTDCYTKYVDARGGRADAPDQIHINHSLRECNHDKVIVLGPNTLLINEAVTGKFSYFVNDVHSNIKCTLKRSTPYKTLVVENNRIQHKFFINGTLSDIVKFEFQHEKDNYYDINIKMYFKDNSGKVANFNLETILGYGKNNGGMDNIAMYLKDDVELRYHHNGIYALLKSDKSFMDIIKEYKPISISFGISMFVYADKEDAIVSIGSGQKDEVLYNDPTYKTYLAGNKGNNSYIVTSGRDFLKGPNPPVIPEVEIYSADGDYTNTLDLHSLSQQIKEDLGKELLMKHIFDSEKLVVYLYTLESQSKSFYNITSITFKNVPNPAKWDSWCKSLHILLNNAPVVLKCDQGYKEKFGKIIDYNVDVNNYDPSNYYTPLPLQFSGYEIIMIRRDDVEPNTEVIVKHILGEYRFLRHDDDLVLTNGFHSKTPAYLPTALLIKDFYKDPSVFYTLKFTFNDKVVSLNSEKDNIGKAKTMEDRYKEYDQTYNNIISGHPRRHKRDLAISKDSSKRSEYKQSQFSTRGLFGTVMQSLSDICSKSFDYVQDCFKQIVSPTPKPVLDQFHNPKADFSNGYKMLGPKSNVAGSNENKIASDVNSTLLLLDTLVRKLNDSKYKPPLEDYLLSPHEQLEKKMAELTTKLGLDPHDILGSMEKRQQQILANITQD